MAMNVPPKRVSTPIDKLQRLKAKLPDIITPQLDFSKVKQISQIIEKDLERFSEQDRLSRFKHTLLISNSDVLKESALALILTQSKLENQFPSDIQILNGYTFVNIFLGQYSQQELDGSQTYQTLADINPHTLITYLGYHEFDNKRLSEILEQVFEQQRVQHKSFQLFYKHTQLSISQKYPQLFELFNTYGTVIQLPSYPQSYSQAQQSNNLTSLNPEGDRYADDF